MRPCGIQMRHSSRADAVVFRVAVNPITSKWSVFREATLDVFSEHAMESKARTACCRHDAALKRRISAQPLAIFATPRHSSLSATLP
jgi:hypothetical protein